MDDLTYIMSTHIKFHEGVLLCLGAMIILVSMGDTKIIIIMIFSSIRPVILHEISHLWKAPSPILMKFCVPAGFYRIFGNAEFFSPATSGGRDIEEKISNGGRKWLNFISQVLIGGI